MKLKNVPMGKKVKIKGKTGVTDSASPVVLVRVNLEPNGEQVYYDPETIVRVVK